MFQSGSNLSSVKRQRKNVAVKKKKLRRWMTDTLKEREWGAKADASPWASEKHLMKGTVESAAIRLWAWASTSTASSTAFFRTVKSIIPGGRALHLVGQRLNVCRRTLFYLQNPEVNHQSMLRTADGGVINGSCRSVPGWILSLKFIEY